MTSRGCYVCWEWQRDDGGYCPYPPTESNTLETAWVAKQKQCHVGTYVVDLKTMRQRRPTVGKPESLIKGTLDYCNGYFSLCVPWGVWMISGLCHVFVTFLPWKWACYLIVGGWVLLGVGLIWPR